MQSINIFQSLITSQKTYKYELINQARSTHS